MNICSGYLVMPDSSSQAQGLPPSPTVICPSFFVLYYLYCKTNTRLRPSWATTSPNDSAAPQYCLEPKTGRFARPGLSGRLRAGRPSRDLGLASLCTSAVPGLLWAGGESCESVRWTECPGPWAMIGGRGISVIYVCSV